MNSIIKQIPPPHFVSKLCVKRGCVFSVAYGATCICIQSRLHLPFNAHQNFMNIIMWGFG